MREKVCLLLLIFAATAHAQGELHPRVRALKDDEAGAAKRILAMGKSAKKLIPDLEAVMRERPSGGKGLLDQAQRGAAVLGELGEEGRAALVRALIIGGNPQAGCAAAAVVAAKAKEWGPEISARFVDPLLAAMAVVPPRHLMMLHWHPWQPLYRSLPTLAIRALGAIGPPAAGAARALKAMMVRYANRETLEALIAIVPEDEERPLFFTRFPPGEDDFSWAAEWLRSRGDDVLPVLEAMFGKYATGSAIRLRAIAGLIAERGEAAHPTLLRLLKAAKHRNVEEVLVTVMGEKGTAPPGAVPLVAARYREGLKSGGERWTMAFFSHAGAAGEKAVMDAIGDRPWHGREWGAVFRAAPAEFVSRLSRRWLNRNVGELPHDLFVPEEAGAPRTRAVGGGGGGVFREVGPDGRLLTGFTASVGILGTRAIVKRLVPLFGEVRGKARGRGGRAETTYRAPEGYAVAGLLVKSGDRIDGLAILFARRKDDRLDMSDALLTPWFGGYGGGPVRRLGGDGAPVTGIHGRSGADLDGLGLIGAE